MATRVLLVEDEPKAQQHLKNLVQNLETPLDVVACLSQVKETVNWLNHHEMPDLMIMDIQLSDGLSFEILDEVSIDIPIIFTTAYDQYAIKAFKTMGIDYILKPVTHEHMVSALEKYYRLYRDPELDWSAKYMSLLQQYPIPEPQTYKNRFLLKTGNTLVPVLTDQIAYFFRQEIVFAKTFDGRVFPVDFSLGQLQSRLDPKAFVRLNRQLLANVTSIVQLRSSKPGQFTIELQPTYHEPIQVSQERSSWLRHFLSGEA